MNRTFKAAFVKFRYNILLYCMQYFEKKAEKRGGRELGTWSLTFISSHIDSPFCYARTLALRAYTRGGFTRAYQLPLSTRAESFPR